MISSKGDSSTISQLDTTIGLNSNLSLKRVIDYEVDVNRLRGRMHFPLILRVRYRIWGVFDAQCRAPKNAGPVTVWLYCLV